MYCSIESGTVQSHLGDIWGDTTVCPDLVLRGRRRYNVLSAAFVRTVTRPGHYWDGHGLILRVTPALTKQWIQRLRIHGKRRELGLGGFPLVTLAQAREVALTNRRKVRAGGDPLGDKRRARATAMTFEEAAHEVFELRRPGWRNAKHAEQWITTLEQFVFPRIGARSVAEVEAVDVLAVLSPIWHDKPETARRVRQRIGVVLKWAVARGLRVDNPVEAVGQALPRHDAARVRPLSALPYCEVTQAIRLVRAADTTTAVVKLAFEFMVVCAARSGEVRGAMWDEIDFEELTWAIPAKRMKANCPHRVPLSSRAAEILNEAQSLGDGCGLVFPSRGQRALSESVFPQLMNRLGIEAVPHGFRTSFRVWAQERTNVSREVCEAALAHTVKDKAEAAYARSDLFEKRREIMNMWARYLNPKPADVVSLDARQAAG